MQLQKFIGDSMPVVLGNLKEALGSDAIILANRRVGDHIEIIATGSLDEVGIDNAELFENAQLGPNVTSKDSKASPEESAESVKTLPQKLESEVAELVDPALIEAAVLDSRKRDNLLRETPAKSSSVSETLLPSDETESHVAEHGHETKSKSQNAFDTEDAVHTKGVGTPHNLDLVEDELMGVDLSQDISKQSMTKAIADQVRNELSPKFQELNDSFTRRMSQVEASLWGEKDPTKSKTLDMLLQIGIGAELAVELVNRVKPLASLDESLRWSLADLANTLPVASDSTLRQDGVTFVTGPTGAGKTTTILKLAVKKKELCGSDSVVMICADAHRTGVFESLAAHGNALGISVVCASSEKELKELLTFYSNKELVLVDQGFQQKIIELEIPESQAVDINGRSVRHLLVLPATLQSSVAEHVVAEFSKYSTARCVITNLDRPCRVGELFTSIIRHNLRVSYWSDSSDVQKPLNIASASTLVAAAMAMSKRLVKSDDEKYLMELIQPRFSASALPLFRSSR